MYLHIGNTITVSEKHIIGVFDLDITSQSRHTRAFLELAQKEGVVMDSCEDIPKSFIVCDHPYHRQIIYLSELTPRALAGRAERGNIGDINITC